MGEQRGGIRSRMRGGKAWEALVIAKALAVGGERREAAVARIVRPTNLFQPYTTTGLNRYPEEFAVLAEHCGSEQPRILSFGCSSGDELLTLHQYFPGAKIHGIDANPLAVRNARKRVVAAGLGADITVEKAVDAEGERSQSYDLATALAVFRHGALAGPAGPAGPPRSCADFIRFADFERTITGLVEAVKPGGLFVIRHANFRFTDCAVAPGFELVRGGFASAGASGLPSPVYGRDNELLDLDGRDDGIYRRL